MSLKVYGSDHSAYDLTECAFAVEGGIRIRGTNTNPVDMDSFWRFGNYYAFYDSDVRSNKILNLPEGLKKAFTMTVVQSSGMTENDKHFYPLQTITTWDGSAIYRRAGTIYINSSGTVTKNEWKDWSVEFVKQPIPEDQLSYMKRVFKYGDINGGSSNSPISFSDGLTNQALKNPAYLGGFNLVITDLHRSNNVISFGNFVSENADLITAVINCGDNFHDSFAESGGADWLNDQFTPAITAIIDAGVPYISCVGNHDANGASIDDLVSLIRPKALSMDVAGKLKAGIFGLKTTTPDVTYGYFDEDEEVAALKARHLGYLFIIENMQTGYSQPYLILNEYDIDSNNTSDILRSSSVDTREDYSYISQTQALSLLQDLEGFYSHYATINKVLPLITVSHFIMLDNSASMLNGVNIERTFLQNKFTLPGTAPTKRAINAYSHRFQSGGGNWITWGHEDDGARITFLGMVGGGKGLSDDGDVAVRGKVVSNLANGKTSDWYITKRTLDVSEPYLYDELYKRIGVNIAGHNHTDYVFVPSAGVYYSGEYTAAHSSGFVIAAITSVSSSTGTYQQKTNDIIHDDFYKYRDLLFTAFGYTASGYYSSSGDSNNNVEWMLVRFGERHTLGDVDRSVDYYGYKPSDLIASAN